MKIAVLGAGAWGTALAMQASQRHEVVLWARNAEQAQTMARERCNAKYLPGIAWPDALQVTPQLAATQDADLTLVATPMGGLRGVLSQLPSASPVMWLCKGLEQGTGLLGHEIASQVCPARPVGVLSGPSFADEVAQRQPTALVAASEHAELRDMVAEALRADALRVYTSADPIGVEVGGAVKNVLAIAAGLCDGLAERHGTQPMVPGLNARAALITRGLTEMTRLGLALGAKAETFMGLSGLGDLVLTTTGALSRNRRVGLRLAQGLPLAQVLNELGHVAEGVVTAPVVLARAQQLGVEMPITRAVVAVLQGKLSPDHGVQHLMSRDPGTEAL